MNRRNLLTAAAASVMLPGAVNANGKTLLAPDAELMAVCADYLRIQRAFEAYFDTLPGDIENDDPAWSMLEPVPALVERIVSLRAITPEGHLARGRCLVTHYLPGYPGCQDDPEGATEDRFKAAILRDLVQMERSAP